MHGRAESSDAALIARLTAGDATALAALFGRHYGRVHAVARAVVGDAALAEDVAHEAFLAAWRGAHTYHPERSDAGAWLCAIARNRALDALRRSQDHQRRIEALRAAGPAEAPPSPHRQVVAGETARETRAALETLPSEQRRVVERVYFGGLSQSQIADADGVPLGTVKGRMRLAFRKLRPRLGDQRA